MKRLLLVLALASFAKGQPEPRNSVTVSGGSALGNFRSCCRTDTAVSLGATYGYRWFSHLQIEAGIVTALHPTSVIRGANYTIEPTDVLTWVPFGLRGVLLLRSGRLEISAGGGGVFEHYSAGNLSDFVRASPQNTWGGYIAAGAMTAIGRSRHFWLGASSRGFFGNVDRGGQRDQWIVVTGDLSVRF